MFYSLSILILLAPLIFLVISYRDVALVESQTKTSAVISSELKNFIESSEVDFKRALTISGKSAVASSVNLVVSTGVALVNSTQTLSELTLSGTINNQPIPLMEGNSISNWSSKLASKGSKYFMNSTTQINYVYVNQSTPFSIDFTASLTVNASIESYGTKISKTFIKTIQVPLQGIEDPLYQLNSNGLISRIIALNSSTLNKVNALDNFVNAKQYVQSQNGPSFLDRLEGKTNLSIGIGVESIININEFIAQEVQIKQGKTMIDYLYFSNASNTGFQVEESSLAWLLLDPESKTRYGVS